MKYARIFGLAAFAAMALTVFVGAGPASATVLCKEAATSGCPDHYTAGTAIHITLTSGTTLVFESSGGTVLDTCTESTIKSKTGNTGGSSETVKGDIEALTWGSCTRTTTTLSVGSLEFHHIPETTNATLTATGSTEFTIDTIFGSCIYGSGPALDLGTVTGGNPATISINTNLPKISGNFACPTFWRMTANYTFTAPKPLYISAS